MVGDRRAGLSEMRGKVSLASSLGTVVLLVATLEIPMLYYLLCFMFYISLEGLSI